MFVEKSVDWWRNQILLVISDCLKNPSDITSSKIKSLLKNHQFQQELEHTASIDGEHERAMDYH